MVPVQVRKVTLTTKEPEHVDVERTTQLVHTTDKTWKECYV